MNHPDEALVREVYRHHLRREPDSEGLQTWSALTARLRSGGSASRSTTIGPLRTQVGVPFIPFLHSAGAPTSSRRRSRRSNGPASKRRCSRRDLLRR